MAMTLTPVTAEPGFSAGPQDLVMSRNAKGRFAGTQLAAMDLGDVTAGISMALSGRLRGSRGSGRIVVAITITDAAGTEVDHCDASVPWSATRAAGRVFGGATSQDHPVVVLPMDDGSSLRVGYELAGSLKRRSARGSLKMSVTGTDAAGATSLTCSDDVTWKAATG